MFSTTTSAGSISKTVEKVCPLASDLSREACKNIACPVSGCKKILPQLSALRFHKIKVHGILENETDRRISRHQKSPHSQMTAVSYQYHCPSSGCIYSPNDMKYFKTFKLLKQHYMKVHAVKRHVCEACDASFGLAYDLNRHLKNCRSYYNAQSEYMISSDDVSILPTDAPMPTQAICKFAPSSLISNESSLGVCNVTSSAPTENMEHGVVVNSSEDLSTSIQSLRNISVQNSSLLPKSNGFLVPVLLPLIIMPVGAGPRPPLPRRIAPKTRLVDGNSGRQDTKPAEVSVATHCSRSAGGLRRKAAETQTSSSLIQLDHPSSRHRKRDLTKGPLQGSSRSNGLIKYRAISHSHTQTHGKHLKSHLVCQSMMTTTLSKSNATQTTVDYASQESTRTQTVESYLCSDDTSWLPVAAPDLSRTHHYEKNCPSGLEPSVKAEYSLDCEAEIELFNSSRDVSAEQFDRLLGELSEHTAPRLSSLSSASQQTVAIDNDAVSTQTMDCDCDDFDLSNNETQTDLLDVLFGFSDIETQTAHQMQLWDSETQTCFDSLL